MPQLLLINPKPGKRKMAAKKRRKTRAARTRKNPAKRRRSRKMAAAITSRVVYRRNPIGRGGAGILGQAKAALMPSAVAAGGAIGVDLVLGYLPIPENLKTGALRHVTRGAASVGVAMLAGLVAKPDTARQVLAGGLTLTWYGVMRDLFARFGPGVRLAAVDDDDLGGMQSELSALLADEQMRALVSDGAGGATVGDFSPAFASVGNSGFDDSEFNN